jgi:parallel beta-helix repeat protein
MEAPRGYRVSYVTSSGNDHAGIHVVGAIGGLIEHTLTWGNGDAGFGIEGCSPCRSVVTDSEASHNSTGLAATNAGGDLFVVGSTFQLNRVGIALTSDADADRAPQHDAVIAANLVTDNDDLRTPQTATGGFGVGIVVGGGRGNRIEHNRVTGHDGVGIALTDTRGSGPRDNIVRANVLGANRTDLAMFLVTVVASAAEGNCFADNEAGSTMPRDIEALLPCGGGPELPESLPPPTLPAAPNGVAPAALPPPGDQPPMPNAVGAPAVPADHLLPSIDVDALVVPPATAG